MSKIKQRIKRYRKLEPLPMQSVRSEAQMRLSKDAPLDKPDISESPYEENTQSEGIIRSTTQITKDSQDNANIA